MKHFIAIVAVIAAALFAYPVQEVKAQSFVSVGFGTGFGGFNSFNRFNNFNRFGVGGFNRFGVGGLSANLAINGAIRRNSRANLLQAQAQVIQARQFQSLNNRAFRQNLRSSAFLNNRADLQRLQTFRQLQQFNNLSRVSAFNQSVFFDPRQANLINRAALLRSSNLGFVGAGHCR